MHEIQDFYIGSNNGSGIHATSWDEFVEQLHNEYLRAVEAGKTTFDITIEN